MSRTNRAVSLMRVCADALLLVAAFFVAFEIHARVPLFAKLRGPSEHLMLIPAALTVWMLIGYRAGLYTGWRLSLLKEVLSLGRAAVLTGLVLSALAFLGKQAHESRGLVVLYMLTALSYTVAMRVLVRAFRTHDPTRTHRVIVVGSGPQAEEICRKLRRRADDGVELVGLITEDKRGSAPLGISHLGGIEESEAIFRREVVDEVIFAVPRKKVFEVEAAFAAAEDLGINTKLVLTFLPNRFSRVSFAQLDGTPALAFTSGPDRPLELVVKRAFDIMVSLVALVLCAPLFLVVAVAIKLTSKGPVFFSQKRTGLNGREFRLWKFRSMVTDAEDRLQELQSRNEMSGPVFKMKDDPRITGIGRLIRKTSIDELPQFWNVLVGDMSVVGPRPLFDVKQYDERWQCRRLSVKPGITCTWQISGRNQIDFDTWMKLDLAYIDQWSLGLDLKIFLKTIPAVLLGKGAR